MLNIINALSNNQLICFPTETVYALSCNAKSIEAISQIYDIKKRTKNKPLSIFVHSIQQLSEIAIVREHIPFIQYFSPGPITFVLPLKDNSLLPKEFFQDTIGIRIPNHPTALAILNEFKSPIVATSINISGKKSIARVHDMPNYIKRKIHVIIENDQLVLGTESTIVDLTTNEIAILRKGIIIDEKINTALSLSKFKHVYGKYNRT